MQRSRIIGRMQCYNGCRSLYIRTDFTGSELNTNNLNMPDEELIQRALDDYLHGPHAKGSLRRAAYLYGVPRSTLSACARGTLSLSDSHKSTQLLSPSQVQVVKDLIAKKDRWGFAVNADYVRAVVASITDQKPGRNWVTRFIGQEPELESIFYKARNKERHFSTTYNIFNSFYTLVSLNYPYVYIFAKLYEYIV